MWKFMFVQRSRPTSTRGRKLAFGRLTEGPPKPKVKIWNPEPGRPKWGMENDMFLNIQAPMARGETQFTKNLCNYDEDAWKERVYLLVYNKDNGWNVARAAHWPVYNGSSVTKLICTILYLEAVNAYDALRERAYRQLIAILSLFGNVHVSIWFPY
jgi:hypothetical protein